MENKIIVSCVHAGNQVPLKYVSIFKNHRKLLNSHYGFDPGSLKLAICIARKIKTPLYLSKTTRLLIELDCSLTNKPYLFSKIANNLDKKVKQEIIDNYYGPFYRKIESLINKFLKRKQSATHLVVHSFAPRLSGSVRDADIGILYNPRIKKERALAEKWITLLKKELPNFNIRKNYPYQGIEDGIVQHLRKKFSGSNYFGLEIEVNNKHLKGKATKLHEIIALTFQQAIKT